MATRRSAILLVGLLALHLAGCGGDQSPSQPPPPPMDEAYDPGMARSMTVQALNVPDPAAAEAALEQVVAIFPPMVDGWLLLAAKRTELGDVEGAFQALDRLAQLGIRAPVDAYPPLQPLQGDERWAGLVERLDAHMEPAGSSEVLFTLPEPALLAEGVAYDPETDSWFVSGVHGRKIVRLGAEGAKDWFGGEDDVWGIFGLATDVERRRLWAVTAGIEQMRDFDPAVNGHSALLELDLDSGELVGRYALEGPQDGGAAGIQGGHRLNDVTVAADGTVYVSDLLPPGGIYRLEPGAEALERIGESMASNSPQGLALVDDDSILVMSDYSLGLVALDVASGESWYVEPPDDLWLQTLDGLASVGDGELVAVQNGAYPPHRILRLQLSADSRSVESWEILAKNLPQWNEPTLGTVVRDGQVRRFAYVANSQWARFPAEGEPDAAALEEPRIMVLDL